jgi:hypothetical protein
MHWKDVGTLRTAIFAGVCLLAVLVWPAVAKTASDTVLNRGDGSRTPAVHRIPLYTEVLTADTREKITAESDPALPFSMRGTCSECHILEHNYDVIRKGWHFNSTDANVPAGRPGQPWIYVDAATGTQIPLSYRAWPGTFKPDQVGMSPFKFTEHFGRHMPGGGPGEVDVDNQKYQAEIPRQMVAGKLEINCLSCHDEDPAHDQAEWAAQIERQNFRWATTASSSFASVSGSASKMDESFDFTMPDTVTNPDLIPQVPKVTYRPNTFDPKDNVFFNVTNRISADRCYFCHSDINVTRHGTQQWQADQDVHMTSGMTCVDCHREGLEHNTIRGYEGEVNSNVLAARTTCQGCHLGDEKGRPQGGRLGAPVPQHLGIPAVHFERLTCTACHSGPWPADETYRCKTAQAHALGTHNVNKAADVLPHIIYPVFAKQTEPAPADPNRKPLRGPKIAPHKLIWPAYWATLGGEKDVQPIPLATVTKVVSAALKDLKVPRTGDWAELKEEQIAQALKALGESVKGKAVYITGGTLYQLGDGGKLDARQGHPAAAAYPWPIAHNVRPAAQSLGVGKCTVCHSTNSAFFFGKVGVDSPIASVSKLTKTQYEFQKAPYGRTWAFAMSFIFRPWFKVVAIGSSAVIGIVLLLFGLRALGAVARVLAEQEK